MSTFWSEPGNMEGSWFGRNMEKSITLQESLAGPSSFVLESLEVNTFGYPEEDSERTIRI